MSSSSCLLLLPCLPLVSIKVKCTLVQALRLCTGRTTHRGSRGIALPFHDHGTSRGWGVSVTLRPLFTPEKDPVPIVQKAGCIPGPVWTGAENFGPTGIRSPDRPACSQSLYRLRYPAHIVPMLTSLVSVMCFRAVHAQDVINPVTLISLYYMWDIPFLLDSVKDFIFHTIVPTDLYLSPGPKIIIF